ncbi:MAG: 50S ribosomal protein L6, partial [Halioglobus sp.]|nr:50S ribosomal protein L6 [Halioglobus sp.]
MSRVANDPIKLPNGVDVKLDGQDLTVKGGKGTLQHCVAQGIEIKQEDGALSLSFDDSLKAMAGTTRALVNNMVVGVSEG